MLFSTSVRRRAIPWWTILYAALVVVLAISLWPRLGDLQLPVAVYGVVLALTAMTSARVNAVTAVGGAAFLLSDSLLALRMFWPDAIDAVVRDPWQDFAIMLLYCLGEGLIAVGAMRRLGGSAQATMR